MWQGMSLKSESKTHDLNHDLYFTAHTFNCVCHRIKSIFRVLGVYNFANSANIYNIQNKSGDTHKILHTIQIKYHHKIYPTL